ncbi:MAG: right-handed parallel beta-helix repeat-containing protein [Saprospiraceae bacterium]|nr:right-handed parallel beta-helix repeat-containing protein [Saprospiraceae bacterium]
MVLNTSTTFYQDTIRVDADWDSSKPILTIQGEGLVIDFNGLVLIGAGDPERPDLFAGTAIRVETGRDIRILQAKAHGFKVGLFGEDVSNLDLQNCDFSYNYRQRLGSTWAQEDENDWLYFHQNESDEWLRYGAGVYLKNCDSSKVHGLTVEGGQNGLMLVGCDQDSIFDNTIRFNSGVGIGLYRSGNNWINHNRLDWNVRGYSHGKYARGQDSAGILCYEQSSNNTFSLNSATHCGDGFFLWTGQSTMDSGAGGCNDNHIFYNDFSHAPANGIEVTFSRNVMEYNRLEDCRYGIWGGYSYESIIRGNRISNNDFGVAIEHGHGNMISQNRFSGNQVSIKIWEREEVPTDWGFVNQRDVSSRNYVINQNLFLGESLVLDVQSTDSLEINANLIWDCDAFYANPFWKEDLLFSRNQFSEGLVFPREVGLENKVLESLPDTSAWQGIITESALDSMQGDFIQPGEQPQGRAYILVDEWGPYDFRSPSIWLREINEDVYTFLLLGPKEGNWKAIGGAGWDQINPKTGVFPATLVAKKTPGAPGPQLELEFIGAAFTDRFGRENSKGKVFSFAFGE